MASELKWTPEGRGSALATVYTSGLGSLVAVAQVNCGWRLRWYPVNASRVCPYVDLADGHVSIEELIKLDDAGKLRLAKRMVCEALSVAARLTPAEQAVEAGRRG